MLHSTYQKSIIMRVKSQMVFLHSNRQGRKNLFLDVSYYNVPSTFVPYYLTCDSLRKQLCVMDKKSKNHTHLDMNLLKITQFIVLKYHA